MSKTPEEPGKGEPGKAPAVQTPEQAAFTVGKLTLSELYKITGPKMLDAAVRGFTLYEQGKYPEAEKAFRALSVLNPKEPYYMTALGAAYLAQEKLDEALRSFTYSISLSGKDIAAYVNRGEVYLQKGMVEEAAKDFKAAVELDPTGNDGVVHRARVLWAAAMEVLQSNRTGKDAEAAPAEKSDKKPSKSKKKK
ncbi:MAG: tetratricopeptide repeat protein [Myxococcaceae bacterium]|nr:tetratricopeptide repeat protein [Myxococcaceae bacterium]